MNPTGTKRYEKLHIWAIEVDQNQDGFTENAQAAQRAFIRDFGAELYRSVDDTSKSLHPLRFVYFTRIWCPERDKMGAYVRLHFFAHDDTYDSVAKELDEKLALMQKQGKVFQVNKHHKSGIEEAALKGAGKYPEQYYSFVHHISRLAVALFEKGVEAPEIDKIVWTWSHNLFNLLRGYQVPVIEFAPSTVLGCHNL